MIIEIWKPIIGYENIYNISNLGRIKSIRNNIILKLHPDKDGYLRTNISKNGVRKNCYPHTEVAKSFLGSKPENKEINHKDTIKSNNYESNLEYVTSSENKIHAQENGLRKSRQGQNNSQVKLTKEQAKQIRELWKTGLYTMKQLGFQYGIADATVCRLVNNISWINL